MALTVSRGTDVDRGIALLVAEITAGGAMNRMKGWEISRQVGDVDQLVVHFHVGALELDAALQTSSADRSRPLTACARCGQPLDDANCPAECSCSSAAEPPPC
jgi:hypothetical protein